ncbi:MAG TPA: futalosine hydrolase [Phycisphaerales bacterium]|nr:futalosine hydrolase [Phycisphaerales bacterium]
MSILILVSVPQEAEAILSAASGALEGARVVVGGIGRTNAAAATTQAILQRKGREVKAVLCAGIAGALPAENPDDQLNIGDCILASSCVYAEEGIITSAGFAGMDGLGFLLGDFTGNAVPISEDLLDLIAGGDATVQSADPNHNNSVAMRIGPIATVATCSGTDPAAAEIVRRTGALAEAMEGAAVVHAARRLGVPAIELRAISNTTGERKNQVWDIPRAMKNLGQVVIAATQRIRQNL